MRTLTMSRGTVKYTKAIQVRMSEALYRAIKQYMKDTDSTRSEAIRDLLSHGINYHYFVNDE